MRLHKKVCNLAALNHASRVIAVFNGEKSGIKIRYAAKVGVPIVCINGQVYDAIAEKLLCTEGGTFMDEKTKTDIDAGVPMVIVHWDENGTTTSQEAYNLENISLSDWQKEQLARTTLEACRKFYSDPENVKKYEARKAERDETKKRK